MYILVDDENRENEGDLIFPSKDVSADKINFMAKHGRGLICLALDTQLNQKNLNLNYMSPKNESEIKQHLQFLLRQKRVFQQVSLRKIGQQRLEWLPKQKVSKKDIVSPGHVFPIVAKDGGVLIRAGHTEASVDISRLAKYPSAVICEIMNEDGSMAKRDELISFAKKHKLSTGKIEDLIAYRLKKENFIKKKKSDIKLGNKYLKLIFLKIILDGSEHFALIKGKINKNILPRVRVISIQCCTKLSSWR